MSASVFTGLLADLTAESAVFDHLVAGLSASEWELPTPAVGWTVRDQVSHVAFFDEQAVLAASDPSRFRQGARELMALGADFPDRVAERYRDMSSGDLLDWLRRARAELIQTFSGLDGSVRVPWFGPDMSLISSATARLMETWAHGLDVADTFGIDVVPTARLHHIAHLGVRTLPFSFMLRERPVPRDEVRVELEAPDGSTWAWGPVGVPDTVVGKAADFCLVVTQRRHLLDTDLDVRGPVARDWMTIAQAFAGAPANGRAPQRTVGAAS